MRDRTTEQIQTGGGEREMRRHACGEDAKSWRPEFEKKKDWRRKKESEVGGGREQKAEGRQSVI